MNILLPLDSANEEEALLSKLDDVKKWGMIVLEEGRVQSIGFFDTREEVTPYAECIVVYDQNEHIWPFMEENLGILVAPVQRSIEDIVEAFLFRELHDING